MIGGASVDGDGLTLRGAKRTGGRHRGKATEETRACQVLYRIKQRRLESRLARVTAPQRIPPDREDVDEHLNAVVQHAHFRCRGVGPRPPQFYPTRATARSQGTQA